MEPGFLLKGLIIGFSIAAPVGPIGVLCIRRCLAEGFLPAMTAGLGAATADAVYGAIAAFGLTAVTSFLMGQRFVLGLVGGAFLCALGCRIFFSRPTPTISPADAPKGSMGTASIGPGGTKNKDSDRRTVKGVVKRFPAVGSGYLSTFFLTVTNPLTILFFVAVFAGTGLVATPINYGSAGSLVAGVFSGSALWWLALCAVTTTLRKTITAKTMRIVNKLAGIVVAGFGIYSIVRVL